MNDTVIAQGPVTSHRAAPKARSTAVATRPRSVGCALAAWVLFLLPAAPSGGQDAPTRILKQDPTLDHLVTPDGATTTELGSLGRIEKTGDGPLAMILVPGLGFGGEVWTDFTEPRQDELTMYAVTLPGFGGAPAPPTPPEGTSFGEQTWTRGALDGLVELIDSEQLDRPIVVGHWLTGTQLALRLALEHPEKVRGVILLAGSTRFTQPGSRTAAQPTLEARIANVDNFLAPRWFKTVTRETWDDNNYLPGDYAVHPIRALRLWREAARPPLYVWVRYLCEFFAQDVSLDLPELEVPTLVLLPGLEGAFVDPNNDYLRNFLHVGWEGARNHEHLRIREIPDTRIFLWFDRAAAVNQAIDEFLDALSADQPAPSDPSIPSG